MHIPGLPGFVGDWSDAAAVGGAVITGGVRVTDYAYHAVSVSDTVLGDARAGDAVVTHVLTISDRAAGDVGMGDFAAHKVTTTDKDGV